MRVFGIGRHDCQRSIIGSGFVGVATLPSVNQSELLENEKVARVQLNGALKIARCFFPMAFASIDETGVQEHVGIVRQRLSGKRKFTACALVVAKAVIVVIRQRKVNFTRIGLEAHCAFQGGLGQIETSRCMIVASKIGNAMHSGQQTPRLQKVRIAHESFIKKLGCLRQLLSCMDSIGCIGKQRLRAQVKIVREQDPWWVLFRSPPFRSRRSFAWSWSAIFLAISL